MMIRLVALLATLAFVVPSAARAQDAASPSAAREKELLARIAALELRLSALETKLGAAPQPAPPSPPAPAAPVQAESANPLWKDTTLNVHFDGYYAWNANRPADRSNQLRAYDTAANSFSINQTGLMVERASDLNAGRNWGYRLDLMFGQATEALQGSAQNEPRPQLYRNIFQAYGTYVLPVGTGLTVDFGKWASALGPEGNYTKDQINYSRSFFFNFLPFYHMGFRNSYAVNDRLTLAYWLVNGANQTEDFNGFKSQLGQAVIRPNRNLTWTLNYYNGQEHPGPAFTGRLHIIDTYAFWNATPRLTLGGEFDTVLQRTLPDSPPRRVTGGAAYLRYQLAPTFYFGQRYERLNDRAGLFSGTIQNLNELTSTLGWRPVEGFEARLEYRRDFSNVAFFSTSQPGRLSSHQDTFTLGMLWWLGGKAGSW